MPAIRYPYNAVFPVATFSPGGLVCVKQKCGEWVGVEWLGFLCRHGTAFIPGRYCKIQALDVTRDSGFIGSDWVSLRHTEFVLGWVVEQRRWRDKNPKWGVYAIVDDTCLPIIIDGNGKDTPCKKGKAQVYQIDLYGKAG